jgi:hypothetical protein
MLRHLPTRLLLILLLLCVSCEQATAQTSSRQALSGPNQNELGPKMQGHLFGDWGGKRSQFEEHGITFDFQYVADHLWNIKSEQPERFASWNRFAEQSTLILITYPLEGDLFPCHGTLASRRKFRCIPGLTHQSQRHVQRGYLPSRFMVDREAGASGKDRDTNWPICWAGFLWRLAFRCFFHLRADGICAWEPSDDL